MLRSELKDINEIGETHPLINESLSQTTTNLIFSQVESHNSSGDGIVNWKKLPPEQVNEVSSYIPYKEGVFKTGKNGDKMSTGLIALRLVSKEMDKFVENTPSGQLVRIANNLEPNRISETVADESKLCNGISIGVSASSSCGLGMFGSNSLFSFILDKTTALLLSFPAGILCGIFGSVVCGAIAELAVTKIKNNVEASRNEINEIREELKKPIGVTQRL